MEFFSQLAGLRASEMVRPFSKLPKFRNNSAPLAARSLPSGMAMLYGMVEILHVSPLLANRRAANYYFLAQTMS